MKSNVSPDQIIAIIINAILFGFVLPMLFEQSIRFFFRDFSFLFLILIISFGVLTSIIYQRNPIKTLNLLSLSLVVFGIVAFYRISSSTHPNRDTLSFLIGISMTCSGVAGFIATQKGLPYWNGFILGLFLSLLGLVITLFLPINKELSENKLLNSGVLKKCPYCAELIKSEAKICRYCGKNI